MNIEVFDEFDAWRSFTSCVEYLKDREYCKKAVELLAEVYAKREYTYGDKVRFHAILPHSQRRLAMALDKERRAVVIFVDFGVSTAVLFYERHSGGFHLKFVDWITTETKALKNPHPTGFTSRLRL
jgi:hypothetical protein